MQCKNHQYRNTMSLLRRLREFMNACPDREYLDAATKRIVDEVRNQNRAPILSNNILTCIEPGVGASRVCNEELIVTLSTFGDRIHSTALTVESLLEQTVKPNHLILNLGRQYEGRGKIPGSLRLLERRGLEIRFTSDIGPYTKLLPTLKEYPNATIITADDDVLYNFDFISNMVNEHIQHPNEIIASRCRVMETHGNKLGGSFLQWGYVPNEGGANIKYIPESYMGVLYPPDSLDDRVFDEKTFMMLCPSTDDFWFKAMSMLKEVSVRKAYFEDDESNNVTSSRKLTLNDLKGTSDSYDRQLTAVLDHFGLWKMLDSNYNRPWMK